MCATPKTPARRYCRWISDNPRWNIENGVPAGLMICTGKVTGYYWVVRIEGGWRLWKEREDGECEYHDIDTSFGPEPEYHECTCGAGVWRRKRSGPCKHVTALAAALRKIGL